ncbi:hypothetical protein GCM10009777_10990 [Microbacterium pumilum]|uniref:Transposase n=1 Tax=Microbacterium pumilum TaxID=344165 RepID=A0ABP5DFN5_9MICO
MAESEPAGPKHPAIVERRATTVTTIPLRRSIVDFDEGIRTGLVTLRRPAEAFMTLHTLLVAVAACVRRARPA